MASGEGPPPLFKALDAPAVAACVASFLYAEDSARLHASSWLLYHGVVARGTCPVLCSFKANGFGPLARFPAWLACGVQAGRDASRGGGVGTPTSRLDSSDNSHNIGIIGEIDRDVARTSPVQNARRVGWARRSAACRRMGSAPRRLWRPYAAICSHRCVRRPPRCSVLVRRSTRFSLL